MAAAIHARPTSRNLVGTADRLPVSAAPRRPYDAPGVLAHHQALFQESGRRERALAAYLAARLRDAFVESRRGSPRGANAPRTQRPLDHANLHSRRPRAYEGTPLSAPSARLVRPAPSGTAISAAALSARIQ